MQSKTLARGVSIALFCICAFVVVIGSVSEVRVHGGAMERIIALGVVLSPILVGMCIGCLGVIRSDYLSMKWVVGYCCLLLGGVLDLALVTWTGMPQKPSPPTLPFPFGNPDRWTELVWGASAVILYVYCGRRVLMMLGFVSPETRRFVPRLFVVLLGLCAAQIAVSALAEIVVGRARNVWGNIAITVGCGCVAAITYVVARQTKDQDTATVLVASARRDGDGVSP